MPVPALHAPARASRRRPRRRLGAIFAVLLLGVASAACNGGTPADPPFWQPGTAVIATNEGPLVALYWSASNGGPAAEQYEVRVNGTVRTTVPASVRACHLIGLAASTSYIIQIVALAGGHSSLEKGGTAGTRMTTTVTPPNGGAGTTISCVSSTDSDGDRLPDSLETDTGTYQSAANTGTDPAIADTDNDGISDGDEALGRTDLDLIARGARPTHKDLLIELDWLSHAPCPTGPTSATLSPLIAVYAAAPLSNPDGTNGINFIADYGQGGLHTGGTQVPDDNGDGMMTSNPNGPQFIALKAAHFDPTRKGIYHYTVIHAGPGGSAEWGGDDIENGFKCLGVDSPYDTKGLMHEIGHNLLLDHWGGGPFTKRGPNYLSVMSSSTRTKEDCTKETTYKPLRYSDGDTAPLDEAALDESIGICNNVAYDFNLNGVIDPGTVSKDLNQDGQLTVLTDYDDWARIDSGGLASFAIDPD